MIAIRSLTGTTSSNKPSASKSGSGKSAGNLLRGLESLQWGIRDLGAAMVGGSTLGESLVRTVHAKPPMGPGSMVSDSSRSEPSAERDCGA